MSSTTITPSLTLLTTLLSLLSLPPPSLTHSIITTHFSTYLHNFLQPHPAPNTIVDPDLRQITLRIGLAAAHPTAGWLWAQQPSTEAPWSQDEHAAAFVHSVLAELVAQGHWDARFQSSAGGLEGAVRKVHVWLCVLQSLWLGDGVWVEGKRQREGRKALGEVLGMERIWLKKGVK